MNLCWVNEKIIKGKFYQVWRDADSPKDCYIFRDKDAKDKKKDVKKAKKVAKLRNLWPGKIEELWP